VALELGHDIGIEAKGRLQKCPAGNRYLLAAEKACSDASASTALGEDAAGRNPSEREKIFQEFLFSQKQHGKISRTIGSPFLSGQRPIVGYFAKLASRMWFSPLPTPVRLSERDP